MQWMAGLESPGVEIGVDQVRASVVAYPSRYRLTGGRAHRRSPSGTWVCEEIEVRGLMCECQRDNEIVPRILY
jgi:hypothetical protein